MPRICILTSVHPHDDVRIFHRQAKSLRAAGYDVTILCPDWEGERDGVLFHKISLPGGRFWRMREASRLFFAAALRQHADVYHIHDPELLPAGLRLRRAGRTVVYDAHEELPLQLRDKPWLPRPLRPAAALCAGLWEERAVSRLSGCVAATRDIAARLRPRARPAAVVRNFPEPRELERPFVPFAQRPRQAAYVGGLTRSRGMLTMVEAAAHTDVALALAGPVDDMSDFEGFCKLSGTGRVDYRGRLNRDGVADLLAQSRAGLLLLHPTAAYKRSLPIKLFEYMLAGLPVIASDFPLWRELAGRHCAVFVNPLDVASIAMVMTELIDNPARAEEMGRAGKALALERYSFPPERAVLLDYYRELLS